MFEITCLQFSNFIDVKAERNLTFMSNYIKNSDVELSTFMSVFQMGGRNPNVFVKESQTKLESTV